MPELKTVDEKGITLEYVAQIIGGQILTRVVSKNSNGTPVPVLMPKAIASGTILKNYLGEAVLEKDVKRDKYTRKGDVVIKLSAPYDAAYVMESEEGLLIPSFCAAIRITKKEQINAKYLTAYLNTSYARNLLSLFISGSANPMIKIKDMRSLKIPNVPAQDMEDIGESYILSGKKKQILQEMIQAEDSLMENIVLASIKEAVKYE